LSLYQLIIII